MPMFCVFLENEDIWGKGGKEQFWNIPWLKNNNFHLNGKSRGKRWVGGGGGFFLKFFLGQKLFKKPIVNYEGHPTEVERYNVPNWEGTSHLCGMSSGLFYSYLALHTSIKTFHLVSPPFFTGFYIKMKINWK